MILPTAEPFLLPGQPGQPAVLLIHGFTGAPKEMRWMGEYLNGQGYTCLGIRLAGHATRPKDMIRSRYTDWMASVEDGYCLLRGLSNDIFLVGLSMGGALSLLMSTKLDVRGVVAMSTPNQLPVDYPIWAMKLISIVMPFRDKSSESPGEGWFDKNAWQEHISYPQNPTRSGAELKALLGELNAALPKVNAPVLLIHSKDDPYVRPENMPRIYTL
ncbi:MAG: alpha/beta fold hydrolase, partial [Chloroflexota bacterium]